MAFHQPQIHMPISKVLLVTANRITIPFHPLLKQIAAVLHFAEPVYHILDLSKNSVYVSVEKNIMQSPTQLFTLTYVGELADTVEESCEIAAKKVVHNLIKRWGVLVRDLTFERYSFLERCSRLYNLKRSELTNLIKEEDMGDLEENVPGSPANVTHVYLDYMPLLRKIFKTIAIQYTPLETVSHWGDRYTSWMIVQPLFNNASKEVFIGPTCESLVYEKNYLAKKVIMYLIPAYNLDIVDANYGSRDLKSASLHCDLELESYLSIRSSMNGVPDEPTYSCLLIERDEMAFENAIAHIPPITPTPVKAKSLGSKRLASPRNVVVCQAGPYPVYSKAPPQQGSSSKRAKNV